MKMHTLIFCSTLVISNVNAMEIIKKTNTKHKNTVSLEQQVYILEKLSRTKIVKLKEYGTFYVFSSKKNYKQFLTLPKESREEISHFSNNITGIIQQESKWNWHYTNLMGTIVKLKWIILDNKNKKISLPKIFIKHDGSFCYT